MNLRVRNSRILTTIKIVLMFSIVLAIFSSFASAALVVNQIVGSQGVSYRMMNDTVGINVTSSSPVSITNGPACTNVSQSQGVYICIVTDRTLSSFSSYQLVNENGNGAQAVIKVDNTIGAISYNLLAQNGSVALTYTVKDTGFNSNTQCSGIKKISVFDGNSEINSVNINGAVGTCDYTGQINLSVSSSGTKSISLKVFDNVGNVKTTPAQNITLDLDAPEIVNGMKILTSGTTQELNTISSSASFFVDIEFQIRENNLDSITADLSGININPAVQYAYKNFNVPISNCVLSNDSSNNDPNVKKLYTCVVRVVPLKIGSSSVKIVITARDTSGAVSTRELTKSFTIDNTIPQVSIKTDKCDSSGRCYVKNGENNIILTLNKNNFEKKLVFFSIPGSTFGTNRVQNCTGSECSAKVAITCTSGSQIEVTIASSNGINSQDDSGNVITPYNTYLYCDNTAPKIEEINVTGQTSTVIMELVSGSNIVIDALVREAETSELTVNLWLDKLKNSTEDSDCEKISDSHFRCTLSVGNINPGYYDAQIVVNATDIVGNNELKTKSVKVFGFKSDNETPDNLGIRLGKVYPEKINRIVLDMATYNAIPYYVYATYSLNVVRGNNIDILYQSIDLSRCLYSSESGEVSATSVFESAKISNPYAKTDDTSRIEFLFPENTDPNLLDDEFEIICNVSATVKEGNYIYKKPQQLELRIPFKLENSKLCNEGQPCTPGERIGKKIEDAEDNFLVRAEILQLANSILPKMQQVCNIRNMMTQATTASTILSMAANAVAVGTENVKIGDTPFILSMRLFNLDACFSGSGRGSYSGIGSNPRFNSPYANDMYNNRGMYNYNTMPGYGGTINNQMTSTDFVNLGIQNGGVDAFGTRQEIANKCSKIVGDACDFLSCAKAQGTNQILNDDLANRKAAAESNVQSSSLGEKTESVLFNNIEKVDYRNSGLMAATHGCWPAVIYNANKWRQAECNYVYCLKMAAYSGTDISACEKAKFTQKCSLFAGEVMELPGIREYKNFAENAADYVKNFFPLAAASIAKKQLCPDYVKDDPSSVLSGEKLTPPQTLTQQTWQMYGCQLPIQLARLADSNMRSNTRGAGNFIYPELPDMCKYAECIGEENCQYEPDFWQTLNDMRLFTAKENEQRNKISDDRNKAIVESNIKLEKMRELNKLGNRLQDYPGADLSNPRVQAYEVNKQKYNELLKEFKAKGEFEDLPLIEDTLSTNPGMSFYIKDGNTNVPIGDNGYYPREYYRQEIFNEKTNKYEPISSLGDLEKLGSEYRDDSGKLLYSNNLKPEYVDKEVIITRGATTTPQDLEKIKTQYRDYHRCLSSASQSTTAADNIGGSAITGCDKLLQRIDLTSTSADVLSALSFDPSNTDLNIVDARQKLLTQAQALNDIEYMNTLIGDEGTGLVSSDKSNYNTYNTKWGKLTDQQLIEKRQLYYESLGLCKPTCEDFQNRLSKGDPDALNEYDSKIETLRNNINTKLPEYDKAVRSYEQANKFGGGLYIALQYLNAQKMLEWMYTDYWTEKWFGDKFSNYVDPNKWKEHLCNPVNPINTGKSSNDEVVISCSNGICKPVLTYTAELTELEKPDGTKYYLITAVYYISGGDLRGRDTKYNVYFYGDNPSAKTLKGFEEDKEIKPFDIVQKKTIFSTPHKYVEICIKFDKPFPPDNSLENSYEYCRPIVQNAFNTGSPWTPEEEEAGATGYTNQYDSNGNRIRTSGTNNNYDDSDPGVFETTRTNG